MISTPPFHPQMGPSISLAILYFNHRQIDDERGHERGQSLDLNIFIDSDSWSVWVAAWEGHRDFSMRVEFTTSWSVVTAGSGFLWGRRITNLFCTGWSGSAEAMAGECMRGC